jgi:predicted Rossmann fold nucleotide-binding protein DprA/Smf involved in DNA uptake
MPPLTPNTQAILLLTAPLIVGRSSGSNDLLSPGEFKKLAQRLHELEWKPADLLGSNSTQILEECRAFVEVDRLKRLLARGLQLSQAVDRWQTRAIWVISRPDPDYPPRLKTRLKGHAPLILYGCGELGLLDRGGLAVVGSRHVDDQLFQYAMDIGQLAARAGKPVLSGGAKGIDQAAMRGALEAGGLVCGVLADSLEKQVMNRDHRNMLVEGHLTLVSPYDPNAGFNAGHAMQRNKAVYALSDAALVVSSDVNKGGTWTGAIEQLEKFKQVPVYVRSAGQSMAGLVALRKRGARSWPEPGSADALQDLLDAPDLEPEQPDLAFPLQPVTSGPADPDAVEPGRSDTDDAADDHAQRLFAAVSDLIVELAQKPLKEDDVAEALAITKPQAKQWLARLEAEGVLEKRKKPARYVVSAGKLL